MNTFPVFLISLLPESITQHPLLFAFFSASAKTLWIDCTGVWILYLYVVSQLRQPLKIIFPTYTCENDRRSVKYYQRRFTWMVTLLDFVHRRKLLEPANPDFQMILLMRAMCISSFRLDLKWMERTGSNLITRLSIFYCVKLVSVYTYHQSNQLPTVPNLWL